MQLGRPVIIPMGWLASHPLDLPPPACRWCGAQPWWLTDDGTMDGHVEGFFCPSCDLIDP